MSARVVDLFEAVEIRHDHPTISLLHFTQAIDLMPSCGAVERPAFSCIAARAIRGLRDDRDKPPVRAMSAAVAGAVARSASAAGRSTTFATGGTRTKQRAVSVYWGLGARLRAPAAPTAIRSADAPTP